MPQEQAHHPSGPLTLAITLALAAGFVDAHIYLFVTPVFVANMSGNLIHFGIFFGQGRWSQAGGGLAAIGAFVGGVAAATVHHDREVLRGRDVQPGFLLMVEAGLVLLLPLLVAGLGVHFTAHPIPADYPVILLASFAMGLQASALRRVGSIAVATTYGTGAIVRIGEKVVLAARRADRITSHRRRNTIAVLLAVLLGYVVGAMIAAAAGSNPLLLLLSGLLLVLAAITQRRQVPHRAAPTA